MQLRPPALLPPGNLSPDANIWGPHQLPGGSHNPSPTQVHTSSSSESWAYGLHPRQNLSLLVCLAGTGKSSRGKGWSMGFGVSPSLVGTLAPLLSNCETWER